MIIGKPSLDSKNFNTLVSCSRNIEEAIVPNFIEVIEPYAIEHISKIRSDSKLHEIKNCSISSSDIKRICIPISVVSIQPCCLKKKKLKEIIVDPKSSPEKENFDVVLFYFPETISVTIPYFIEVFVPHSFE